MENFKKLYLSLFVSFIILNMSHNIVCAQENKEEKITPTNFAVVAMESLGDDLKKATSGSEILQEEIKKIDEQAESTKKGSGSN